MNSDLVTSATDSKDFNACALDGFAPLTTTIHRAERMAVTETDISFGREQIPVELLNEVNGEKPCEFKVSTKNPKTNYLLPFMYM